MLKISITLCLFVACLMRASAQTRGPDKIEFVERIVSPSLGIRIRGQIAQCELKSPVRGFVAITYIYNAPAGGIKLVLTGSPQNVAEMLRVESSDGLSASALREHIVDIWMLCASGDPYVKVVTPEVAASALNNLKQTADGTEMKLWTDLLTPPRVNVEDGRWTCSLMTVSGNGSIDVVNVTGQLRPFAISQVSIRSIAENGFFARYTNETLQAAVSAAHAAWLKPSE